MSFDLTLPHGRRALAAAALFALAASATSCSVIGYQLGGAMSANEPPRQLAPERALRLEPGSPVELRLADGSVPRGVFLGLARELRSGRSRGTATTAGTEPETLVVGMGRPFDWNARWNPGQGIATGDMSDFPDTLRVSLSDVRGLTVPPARAARRTGLLVGLGLDATGLAFLMWLRNSLD